MTEYGAFADLVATATALVAATAALGTLFLKRSKWQPPEQSVPNGVPRLASLIAVIFVGTIWIYRHDMGREWLAATAALCGLIALIALLITVRTNTRHSYYHPKEVKEANRVLGGDKLTPEAKEIIEAKKINEQTLLTHSQGDKDCVWTRDSQAAVQVRSVLFYILLIAAGTNALAATGALVATFLPAK